MRTPRIVARVIAVGAALVACCAGAADAPDSLSRNTVVEDQLLPRQVKATVQKLAAVGGTLPASSAASAAERFASARRLIEAGRAGGDPRTLGYAESLLAPWPPNDPRTPLEALLLRATIEQSRHRFDAAFALLDRVLERAPDHGQALLTRATIAQVTGRYQSARADCERLHPLNADAAAICTALIDALTGANERALAVLVDACARTHGGVRGWALGALAQVHEQRGEYQAAAAAYRASLAAGEHLATRLALADLLLEQRAHDEARRVLAPAPPADGVLLRRWLIGRDVGLATLLQARLDQAIARGELLHKREAAVFALDRGDTAAALAFARDNFATQREPADVRILARAARAAEDRGAFEQVRDWVERTGVDDAQLRTILQRSP